MKKKLPDDGKENKPESSIEDQLRKHFTVKKLTKKPTETQIRLMSLHLWLLDVARDVNGMHIFLTLETVAEEYGYDYMRYHDEALKLFEAGRI